MSSEGLSETAEEAHPDNIAQRPASNLLLAGTGLSLALAVSAVVGLSNNDTTVPAPVAASESPADRPVVSLAAPGSNPAAESPSGPQSMTPSAMTPSAMAALPMAPIDMAPLPMDQISVGQLTVDQMPAASPLSSTPAPASSPSRVIARPPKILPASVNSKSQIGLDHSTSPDSADLPANTGDASASALGDGREAPDGGPAAGGSSPAHAGSRGGAAGGNGSNPSGGDSHAGQGAGGSGGDNSGNSDGPDGASGGDGPGGGGGHGGHGGGHHSH